VFSDEVAEAGLRSSWSLATIRVLVVVNPRREDIVLKL
jgi:hypothetical protein